MDILDPSRQVADDYRAYEATLRNGETVLGILVLETEDAYVIRRPSMPEERYLKNQVQSLRLTGKSLMPEGLEAGMSQQGMADLLEFLQRPLMSALPKEYLNRQP